MTSRWTAVFAVSVSVCGLLLFTGPMGGLSAPGPSAAALATASGQDNDGQFIFRYDTFGDEQLWTDKLRMHRVIESALDPVTAFEVGLKVDVEALPPELRDDLREGRVDLNDPATTLALISLDAVVGIMGDVEEVNGRLRLRSVGITCALCHSTVDDSFMPNVGRRLDGWANLDLNPGAIIALSPSITDEAREVYNSWGPGFYDPRFNIDGRSTPLVIPPAYGLRQVSKETYTGEGPISYWNRYVAVTQMGGHGTFIDPRLGIAVVQEPDMVGPKLAALRRYQRSLQAPPPPQGFFNERAAERGEAVFAGKANCAACHVEPLFTDVNMGVLHAADAIGTDPSYAQRTTTKKYRTTPLRALWQHAPYFHDGSAPTLEAVVEHYDSHFDLRLTNREKQDLVEYLKSL